MFGRWLSLQNTTSLHPIAPYTVEVTRATKYFGLILDFLADHDNQTLRRRVLNIECERDFQAMIRHIHFYLLDKYVDWWIEDAVIREGPHLVDQCKRPTAVLCGTKVFSFGGYDAEGESTRSVSIFNLDTNTRRSGP